MTGHFAAFTFVDRITALDPGRAATGEFRIPATVPAFPSCLIAEAVGQLAAWVSISKLDFSVRPVAALAGETRFFTAARPGDFLTLSIDVESCESDAVAYQGCARVNGALALELIDCVGPMLPLGDFDDAEAMRAFFALLTSSGAPPGRFGGVPSPDVEVIARGQGTARARVRIPRHAEFFADHFPRRHVYPATLLLDAQTSLAAAVAGVAAGDSLALTRISDVKQRSFVEPGAIVDVDVAVIEQATDRVSTRVTSRLGDRRLGTARIEFGRRTA